MNEDEDMDEDGIDPGREFWAREDCPEPFPGGARLCSHSGCPYWRGIFSCDLDRVEEGRRPTTAEGRRATRAVHTLSLALAPG